MGIEVKSSATISAQDLRSLRALAEEKILRRLVVVCREPHERFVDGIRIRP